MKYFSFVLFVLFSGIAIAQNKVVVIPMSGDDLKPLANVITVSKQNGDFSDPIAAVNSITDSSITNPYIVVIAPGVYNLGSTQLVIPSFVSLVGSGPKITVLESSVVSSGSGAIVFDDDATLSDLSLLVTGTSTSTQTALGGLFQYRVLISNVHVLMDNANATIRRGLYARVGSWEIRDSRIEIGSGTSSSESVGIFSEYAGSDVVLNNTILIMPSVGIISDPINFGLGGTTSAYCNFVRLGDASDAIVLDTDCN